MVQHLVQSQYLHEDIRLFSFVLVLTPVPSGHRIVSFSRVLLEPIFYQMNYGIRRKQNWFWPAAARVSAQVSGPRKRSFARGTYIRWLQATV